MRFTVNNQNLSQIKRWVDDPNSILSRINDGWFTYDRYFDTIANKLEEVIAFTKAFSPKGIDYYMFKEDYVNLVQEVIYKYAGLNNLVIPITAQKYAIFTRYFNPLHFDELIIGSCDRSIKFKIHIDQIVPDENGMIRADISISEPIGLASKDRDVWNPINCMERRLIENRNDPEEPELITFSSLSIKTCKGLENLKPKYKHCCNQITHDSSGLCDWCFKLERGDFDDDYEPDYSELDQSAEDEAEYYMQLDRDIEIAQGNIPNF